MSTDRAFPLGHRLGPYELIEVIGEGGFGRVYRARDTRLGRDVALKTVADPLSRQDFRRLEVEARALAVLNHPHIVAIHDVGSVDEVGYIVMELLDGENLAAILRRGPLPVDTALASAIQIADALTAAQAKGIVHRDLKPANVFVSADGRVKVLDFGIARIIKAAPAIASAETVTALTEPGAVPGTPSYLAPEQARGELVDERTDLFAFGVVLYEMLAGRPPFRAANRAEAITRLLRDPAPPLPQPTGSPALDAIVWRCLEKDPAARFQTAVDLLSALRAVSLPRRAARRWWTPVAAAAGIVAIVTLGWSAGWFGDTARRPVSGADERRVSRSISIARPVAVDLVEEVFGGRAAAVMAGDSQVELRAPEHLMTAVVSVVRMAEALGAHRFADEPAIRDAGDTPLFSGVSQSRARVALDVRDVSVRGLLQLIARSIGWPAIFDHSAQGTVTLDVTDAPWDLIVRSAMEFQGNNLAASRFGDVWLVSSRSRAAELINSRLSQWVVGSTKANPQQLARAFEPVRSADGLILINARLHKLVIIDRWETFAAYARVLAAIDDIDPSVITLPHLGNRYTGNPIDFDFNNESPGTIVRTLAQRVRANIMVGAPDGGSNPQQASPRLSGAITQARWDNIIDVILLAASWKYEHSEKVVYVTPFGREMTETTVETVRLAREMPQFFEPYSKYLTANGALTIEPSTRTVVIRDVGHRSDLLRRLIRLVDAHEPSTATGGR